MSEDSSLSSRICFMLKDLIEMRDAGYVLGHTHRPYLSFFNVVIAYCIFCGHSELLFITIVVLCVVSCFG